MAPDQKLNWGSINWIYEPEEGSGSTMRIGISHMNPHTEQPPHIHYGDEQMVYIISGHGRQWINDELTMLEPGSYFHIPAGVVHRQVNDTDEPLVKLLASIPALQVVTGVSREEEKARVDAAGISDAVFRKEIFRNIVLELFRNELSDLRVPLTVFDAEGNQVYHSREYPSFCCSNCRIDENIRNCEFLAEIEDSDDMENAYVCRHGLWVYTYPVTNQDGDILGYIKAGHVRTYTDTEAGGYGAISANQTTDAVYSVPDSTIRGIMETVKRIADAVVGSYQVAVYQEELEQREHTNLSLRDTLKDTKTKAFNLQLNQHFLFNTLNALASMAVTENAFATYDGICDLAELLRYTLRTNERFVTLGEEIRYVKNYTSLQMFRFGKKLQVFYDIPEDLLGCHVPFNFIQPVVENCFVHGFRKRKTGSGSMNILISADRIDSGDKNELVITVADNGEGLTPQELNVFREKIASRNDDHGTLMVVQKLASLYADNYSYHVESEGAGKGCKVTITIPVE